MTNAQPTVKLPENLPHTSAEAASEARMQADEYDSLFGTTTLKLDNDDTIEIPLHPDYGMIDDDRLAEYDRLMFEVDTEYEREEDIFIPEQKLKGADGNESGVVLPATTQRGALKVPYRKLGEDGKSVLVTPPHRTKVVMVALGEVEYKRLVEGGRNSGDVWKIWNEQGLKIRERQQRDNKSPRSTVDLEAVPAPDSQ